MVLKSGTLSIMLPLDQAILLLQSVASAFYIVGKLNKKLTNIVCSMCLLQQFTQESSL